MTCARGGSRDRMALYSGTKTLILTAGFCLVLFLLIVLFAVLNS